MKRLIITFLIIISFSVHSQDDKTVTLTVSAQGQTEDEAKQNALRNAIELAFGTFISSNTEILNEELVKDEIVSVSNGNIQDYEVISEIELPNGGFATTLKARVSVTKLTSFVENKGGQVEFKGSLFGANLRQQKLNEYAEYKSIINLCKISDEILSKSIDYEVRVGDPILSNNVENSYLLKLFVLMRTNENYKLFQENFLSVIGSLSMTESEVENYKKINKTFYKFLTTSYDVIDRHSESTYLGYNPINDYGKYYKTYYLRNYKSAVALQNLFIKSNKYLHNYLIKSNLDTIVVNLGDVFINRDNMIVQQRDGDYWVNKTNSNIAGLCNYCSNSPRIWDLNIRQDQEAFGFPYFNFENYDRVFKSWNIYFSYLIMLGNYSLFFDKDSYFENNYSFYNENGGGLKNSDAFPYGAVFPFSDYFIKNHREGSTEGNQPITIGKLLILDRYDSIIYGSLYESNYSESEIAEITNFSITIADKIYFSQTQTNDFRISQ